MRAAHWITWIALATPLIAQAPQTLEARVSSVTNGTAYLDRGRADGIEIGDIVVLYPPGQASIGTTISAVSRTSCRADLPSGVTLSVTGFRNPCGQINGLHEGLMAAMRPTDENGDFAPLAGIMTTVVHGGSIRPGDRIEIGFPPGPHRRLQRV